MLCMKRLYFYFQSKIWRHHCVPPPRFTNGSKNFADSHTFKAEIGLLIFAWAFRTSWPNTGVVGSKIREGVVQCWPQWTHFLLLGFYIWAYFWWKSIKKCNHESVHRQKQTGFIICPMLYGIAMGQILLLLLHLFNSSEGTEGQRADNYNIFNGMCLKNLKVRYLTFPKHQIYCFHSKLVFKLYILWPSFIVFTFVSCEFLQCFDAVGWVAGRASGQ